MSDKKKREKSVELKHKETNSTSGPGKLDLLIRDYRKMVEKQEKEDAKTCDIDVSCLLMKMSISCTF